MTKNHLPKDQELTPELLATYRAEIKKILDAKLTPDNLPDTRTDAEKIKSHKEFMAVLETLPDQSNYAGVSEEELEKEIEEEIAAVRAERAKLDPNDTRLLDASDEK